MENFIASAIASLAGAIVGGALAMWGAIKAVEKTSRDLEAAEIRKERINCLVALFGLRFIDAHEPPAPAEWQARLMYELNKIPVLWADDDEALKSWRRCVDSASADNFVGLFRLLSRFTKLNLKNVRDADLIHYARPNTWNPY